MKRKIFLSVLITLSCCTTTLAQGLDIRLDNRDSWRWTDADHNGISADYLQLYAAGSINEHFSFSVLQHLNRPNRTSGFMDSTDWAWLKYSTGDWSFCGGKMMLEYGGFEYDEAPINLYFCGEYWNNYSHAFTFAAYASRALGAGRLYFQIAASPFDRYLSDGLYAYSLSYRGSKGFYSWKHSVNMFEMDHGQFSGHFVLGNRFDFKPFAIEMDLYHRMDMKSPSFFEDYTVVTKAQASLSDKLDIFAKVDYDFNSTVRDPLVAPGTDLLAYGGGVEFYPVAGSRDIRLHCVWYHRNENVLMAGFTWKFHILTR